MSKSLALTAALLAACAESEPSEPTVPSEPIVLVPDDDFDEHHRAAMTMAAEGWNLAFGTSIIVGDGSEDAQPVQVSFLDGAVPHRGRGCVLGPRSASWIGDLHV